MKKLPRRSRPRCSPRRRAETKAAPNRKPPVPAGAAAPAVAAKRPGAFDIAALDRSVDPCTNFYEFACGGWRKANPIPADQTRWGRFNELAERNREDLHEILEKAKDPKAARSPIEAKVGDYYAACMDEPGIEAKGLAPVQPLLDRVAAVDSKAALFRLLGQHEAEALPALFRFGSSPDMHDSRQTIANVGQGGLGLPDRDDYLNEDAKSKEKREKYVEHVARVLELGGASPEQAKADAATVMRVETALAAAHLKRVEMRDPKNRDNPMTLEELQKLAPAFEWSEYLTATGAPAFTRLNVSSRKYFTEGDAVVGQTPLTDWKTYVRWRLLDGAAPYLGSAFVSEDFRWNRAYLQGAKEIEPRWKRCVQATDRALGDALGQLYVEKTFGADGKARMAQMIEAITAALREDIETLDWMTPDTRKKALAKLEAFNTGKVGYPDKWKDYSSVEVKRDDYFGNSRRARRVRGEARLRPHRQADRPHAVGHDAADGERVLQLVEQRDRVPGRHPPAAVLRPRDRRPGQLRRHRRRDRPRVHARLRRPGEQVRRRRKPRELVDGRRPQGVRRAHGVHREAVRRLRDRQGPGERRRPPQRPPDARREHRRQRRLRVAYAALQKALAGKPRTSIDGFTPEQRFFLGFANVWCQNVTEAAARQLAQTDPHSSGEFRVIGSVSNTPEFAQAFGCKAGQPMVRENACRAW